MGFVTILNRHPIIRPQKGQLTDNGSEGRGITVIDSNEVCFSQTPKFDVFMIHESFPYLFANNSSKWLSSLNLQISDALNRLGLEAKETVQPSVLNI